jgi:hypothetical protein
MPDRLKFTIKDLRSHTYMKVAGEYELESFIDLIKTANEIGLDSESKKMICDVRLVDNMLPSDTDRFRLGTTLAENISTEIYIAAVAAPESINHFVELVANNRGVHFKIFSCQDAAREWLLENDVLTNKRFG